NSSSKDFWTKFSKKATKGIFEQKPVFKGLCYIMLQATECKNQDKGLQNLKYSNKFLNFFIILESISLKALDLFCQNLADDVINNPDLCYENVVRFKRLLDILHYKGCIVGSTLNCNHCKIETYDNIYNKISDIKQKNAVAKYVRAYVLQ
ncbi:22756_t:CDS:2, partial [Gigaspora margarita]